MKHKLNAIVIDDNPDDRLLVIRELKKAFDCTILEISNQKELDTVLGSFVYDVAITDYQLKWSDGVRVLKELKKNYPQKPVIMYTGTGNEEVAVEAMKNGLDDYILKSSKHIFKLPHAVSTLIGSVIEKQKRLKAEQKYEALVTNLGVGVAHYDLDQNIIVVNKAMLDIYGIENCDVIGKKCYNAFKDLNDEICPDCPAKVAIESKSTLVKGPLKIMTDKAERWLQYTYFPSYDENKEINGSVVLTEDVTTIMVARREIIESEEKYRSMVELAPDSIFTLDLEGNITACNSSFYKFSGYEESEILGKNFRDMKFVLGEKMDAFEKIFGSILTGEVPELIEIEWKTKDKRIIFSEVHASISYKDNKISGIQVISRDTTERKKAETLKNVVFNIASAVNIANELNELFGFIKNELAKVIKTENFYIALLDEETDELKLSYYHDSNNHMESFPNVKTLAHYLLNKNNPLLLDENKITDLIKTDVVGEYALGIKSWLGTPLKIKQDTIGVMVVRDYDQKNAFVKEDKQIFEYVSNQIAISIQRKRDYEQLKIAKLAAEESDRLKSAFLANMSHEIRTPMNGILGFAELLKEPELTGEKQEKYIEVIEKSGQRMLNIINDIVDISKIESGLVELQISETNINECIELAFNFFKPEASKKGIKLIHHLNLQTQDAILSTDQEKLNSILINLIKNALKYTDSGKIEFGYTLKKVNSSEYVEFYISDTGIGIQNDRKEAIFDRFIQAEIVDKKARQGAGLGLSISKAYVELLGGKIWVESELGKGSTFYFTLPYSTKKITKVPESNIISDDAHPNRKRLKIMIADDDEVSGQFVSIILAHYYSELLIAQDGAEAVEMCRKNPDIDVVLMDIQMPVMNGYEATKQIREFNKKIIIIAQTAYALYGDKEKSIDVGCNDYISKPIKKEELVSLILKHSNPLVMNL